MRDGLPRGRGVLLQPVIGIACVVLPTAALLGTGYLIASVAALVV